jgi:cytochrome b561
MSDQPEPSGKESYSAPAKWLHWLIAPIVLAMIPVGAIMADLPEGALQDRLFFLHESFGLTVLALMIARIANRLRGAPPPAPSLTRAERVISAATHHAMYLLLALTPVLGWLALSAYGLRPAFFGLFEPPALLAKDEPLSKLLFSAHGAAAFTLAALITLHLLGVARHVFIKRDGVVWRMLPGRRIP